MRAIAGRFGLDVLLMLRSRLRSGDRRPTPRFLIVLQRLDRQFELRLLLVEKALALR